MDPNYHYIVLDHDIYVKRDAPLAELGLPANWDRGTPLDRFFHVPLWTYEENFDENGNWRGAIPYEANDDKFVDYLLKLGYKTRHLHSYAHDGIRIYRVPKDVKDYVTFETRSTGCCGMDRKTYVDFNRQAAIINATRKMLEEPHSLEKVQQLKERIEYLDKVCIETVNIPYLTKYHDHDDMLEYDPADWDTAMPTEADC